MSKVTRRHLLRSSSLLGAGLALNTFPVRTVQAQQSTNRRVIVVSIGHSLDPVSNAASSQWVPTVNTDGTIKALAAFLKPLEPFKDRMVAVTGCDNVVASMVTSNGHNAASRTLLTCRPHAGYTGPGSSLDTNSRGGGPSIEYVLSGKLGVPPLILRSGDIHGEHRRTFLADGSDDHGYNDPVKAFNSLFSSVSTSTSKGDTPLARLGNKRSDIMAAVRSTYENVAKRAGAEDRIRLQSHAALVDSFIKESSQVSASLCSEPKLEIPSEYTSSFDKSKAGTDDDLISRMQNSVMAVSLSCSTAKVASLHYSNINRNEFPFLNGGSDLVAPYGLNWHGVCHHEGNSPDSVRVLAQTWYSEMIADLLFKLDNTADVDGSLLDNTIVVFTSSLANKGHGLRSIPMLMFGGSNSGLRTNQVVDYRGSRTVADVWTTVLQLMGQNDETFGLTGSFEGVPLNNGPLSEIMA